MIIIAGLHTHVYSYWMTSLDHDLSIDRYSRVYQLESSASLLPRRTRGMLYIATGTGPSSSKCRKRGAYTRGVGVQAPVESGAMVTVSLSRIFASPSSSGRRNQIMASVTPVLKVRLRPSFLSQSEVDW